MLRPQLQPGVQTAQWLSAVPHTCQRSTITYTVPSRRAPIAAGRKRGVGSRGGDTGAGEVELFDIDSGWNVEALASSNVRLQDLGDWGVVGGLDMDGDSDAEDFSDDEEELGASSDEEDSVAAAAAAPAPGNKRSNSRVSAGASTSGKVAGAVAGPAERDLARQLPRHVVRELARLQAEADEENAKLTPAALRKAAARKKTHRGGVRIIAGTAAGRRLLSPQGDQTRPMMEMVRGAVFNMIMSMHGCPGGMPQHTRWLDLFAGTGAVGVEALSRGCGEAHFVEMSPWVVGNCLLPNLETAEVDSAAVVHTSKAEDFLKRAAGQPRFAGGAFDFISVCPPYELVSYPELYQLLEGSALMHEDSIVVVEYPQKLAHQILPMLGPLTKLRDRRYGRTFLAVYGPGDGEAGEERESES